MMRALIILFLAFCFTNCNSQIQKSKKMQLTDKEIKERGYQIKKDDTIFMKDGKLDITKLKEIGISSGSSEPAYYQYEGYLNDTYVYISGNTKNGFGKNIKFKKDDSFRYGFSYFPSGELKGYGIEYSNFFKKGIWYDYDIKGAIEKYENYDAPYEFSWEDVKQFLKEQDIKENQIQNIFRGELNGVHGWEIIYKPEEFLKTDNVKVLTLDPKTGKIVKTEIRDVSRQLD